jgi:HEAT repeat protein
MISMQPIATDLTIASQPSPVRLSLLSRLFTAGDDPAAKTQAVAACLHDADPAVRRTAMLVLERCGPDGVGPLTGLLAPTQPADTRALAAASLGRMGPVAGAAAADLGRCLEADDDTLRSLAEFALGRLGSAAVPELQRLLLDSTLRPTVIAALGALGRIEPPAVAAQDAVRKLLPESDPFVQLACAACLAHLNIEDPDGLPRLSAAAADPAEEVRTAALRHIGELAQKAAGAHPVVQRGLGDPAPAVRATAALALARIKPDAVESIQPLLALLADSDPQAALNTTIALGTLGPPAGAAIEPLQRLLGHQDSQVSQAAAAALSRIRTSEA